ncbi:MAG TPA: stage II sporulation protein R [Candidatus Choladousia intestinigallinarum]|nr:stage II sporulation protein R [Candidatus Choladousia intestinigallinarum]
MYLSGIKKYLTTALILILLSLVLRLTVSAAHKTFLQQGIAEEVLRFHVLANSDSEEDQEMKLLVRDQAVSWMEETVAAAEREKGRELSRDEVAALMKENLSDLEHTANQILSEQGADYGAKASLEECYFPKRTYGACTFPAGWYQALRLRLGEAKGQNWWCVLYPKLCFTDSLHAVVPEEEMEKLEEVLTVQEYESLFETPEDWKISFRWF